MKIKIGSFDLHIYEDSKSALLVKHYNAEISSEIRLSDADDIYHIEFAIRELKRKLNLP